MFKNIVGTVALKLLFFFSMFVLQIFFDTRTVWSAGTPYMHAYTYTALYMIPVVVGPN
jgi:hypothetical protein